MSSATAADQSLAHLLAESASRGSSGILHAIRGKHKRLICMDKGFVSHVISNVIEEQFDETLVRDGLLNPAHLAAAKAGAAGAKKKLSAYLLEQQILTSDALKRAMEGHVRQLLLSTLEWPDGLYKFDMGRPNLEGEVVVQLSAVSLLLEYAGRHPASIDEVRMRIGPPNIRPVRSRRAERLLRGISLEGAAAFVLERCDGVVELSQLVEESELIPDDVLRALYGLLLAGVLQSAEAEEPAPDSKEEMVGRDECLARLHQAEGADHYLVLGVDSRATASDIRKAYYFLARRFHPDRFRVGELQDLRLRVEVYFTQVTEAYNTLSDPELRSMYDTELAELVGRKKAQPVQDKRQLARENYARAKLLLKKKRLQEAVTFLENAIDLDEANATYHLELGRVLLLNPRRRSDCEDHLSKAIELDPTSTDASLALGDLFAKTDRKDQARRMYNEVLRWNPDNDEAKQRIKKL
jgi:tetratricopeptide (TPR) repeat protein